MIRRSLVPCLLAASVVLVLHWAWRAQSGRTGPKEHPAVRTNVTPDWPTAAGSDAADAPPQQPRVNFNVAAPEPAAGDETAGVVASSPPDNADAARDWARTDLARALLWLPLAPPGAAREAVLEITCSEVVDFDPAEAVSLAEQYGPEDINLLENLIQRWAMHSGAAAAAYASGKPAGAERDRLLSRVAFAEAATNPIDAARLVAQEIAPGSIQNEAAISVVHEWARQDAATALRWAQSFPVGSLRDRAIQEVRAFAAGATAHLE